MCKLVIHKNTIDIPVWLTNELQGEPIEIEMDEALTESVKILGNLGLEICIFEKLNAFDVLEISFDCPERSYTNVVPFGEVHELQHLFPRQVRLATETLLPVICPSPERVQ